MSGGAYFPVGITHTPSPKVSPKVFLSPPTLLYSKPFIYFGSSVSSSVFFGRGYLATHKARHKAHTRQTSRHTPTAQAQVCFFIDTYLMKLKAVKVNTININQNK